MNEVRFKINIIKLILALLLMSPAFTANIPIAHASLEPLMFSEDANIVKFTHNLIFFKLRSQKRNSLDQNKDNKKNTGRFRPGVKAIVKHFKRSY